MEQRLIKRSEAARAASFADTVSDWRYTRCRGSSRDKTRHLSFKFVDEIDELEGKTEQIYSAPVAY
jgi:hypothetical protein